MWEEKGGDAEEPGCLSNGEKDSELDKDGSRDQHAGRKERRHKIR